MPPEALKVRLRVPGAGQPPARTRAEDALRRLDGVVRVRFEPVPPAALPGTAVLVTVVYRPERIRPPAMVQALEAAGFAGTVLL